MNVRAKQAASAAALRRGRALESFLCACFAASAGALAWALACVLMPAPADAAEDEPSSPAPVRRSVTAVFQFVKGWNVGSPKGSRGYSVLNFLALPDGKRVQVRTEWGTLETLTPGRAYKCTIDFRWDTRWLTACEEYNLQPWELLARVYEVQELVQEDLPGQSRAGLRVRRLGMSDAMWVEQRRAEGGGLEPDPEAVDDLRRYPPGTLVEITCSRRGNLLVLRTIHEYIPPQQGEFLGTETRRVEGTDRLAVSARTQGRSWTLIVPGRVSASGEFAGDRRIMTVLENLRPGQQVTFAAREDKGTIWMESIRPVEEDRVPTSGDVPTLR